MKYTYYLTRYENKVYRVDEEEMDINNGYEVWEKIPRVWRELNHDEIDDFCDCDAIKIDESMAMRLIG